MWSGRLCITFHVSLHVIWGIRSEFPQIAPIPNYLWKRYSSTHRDPWHLSKVSIDVKQGAKAFGLLFMCPCTSFRVFSLNFSKLTWYSSTVKTGIVQATGSPDTRVRSHLMWKEYRCQHRRRFCWQIFHMLWRQATQKIFKFTFWIDPCN